MEITSTKETILLVVGDHLVQPALGIEVVLQEISKHQGTLYDAGVVTARLSLFANKKFSFEYS